MLYEIKDFREKMADEINKHRWLESEKAGRDLGRKAEYEWLMKYEVGFRRYWLENRFSLN